ncbi:MAG TPA: tRNA epoxyqueuosine(34) reductase QueG, partial [Phycisphaerales bacterium]|nr:tRNA epoxyqueuosine(34) reductase QueG [Phycisphaerales bacterium]
HSLPKNGFQVKTNTGQMWDGQPRRRFFLLSDGANGYTIKMDIEANIKRKGLELGFDRVGITSAEPLEPKYGDYHRRWLEDGCAGRMSYLYRNNDKRFAPNRLLTGAQSVICVALNYRPRQEDVADDQSPSISRYALYDDYHGFIKTRLFELAAFVQSLCSDRSLKFKACTDAIPLAERALAHRAGLGFIGRNHALIHPELGGMIFLGELLTTLPLKPDGPLKGDFCVDCGRCIAACPTGALGADGSFDARRCLSYLTIEEPDEIDQGFADKMAGRLFGCDACLMACPVVRSAPPRTDKGLRFHSERVRLGPEDVLTWKQEDFDAVCKGSPIERIGLIRLRRNARLGAKSDEAG